MSKELQVAENDGQPLMMFGSMMGGMSGDGSGGGGFIGDQTTSNGDNVSGGVAPVSFAPIDLSWLNGGRGFPMWGWLAIGGIVIFGLIKVLK